MKGHIYASYWIGFSIGAMVGVIIGFGIMMHDSCALRLPALTMGDRP